MKTRPLALTKNYRLTQPGPAAPDRIQSAMVRYKKISAEIAPGTSICASVGNLLMPLGITAAAIRFEALQLCPMRYVQPTFFNGYRHVAYYSDTRTPDQVHDIEFATATFGIMDGEAFIHCHALWRDRHGRIQGGHVLPYEAKLHAPARVTAYVTQDAAMRVDDDAETNFRLFGLVNRPVAPDDEPKNSLLVAKIRPNEDLITAIERVCSRHGVTSGRVLSGIGSTVGAVFEDGTFVPEIPTEVLVLSGTVEPGDDGHPRVSLKTALIDAQGVVHEGSPTRGANPVLICFELFLEVTCRG